MFSIYCYCLLWNWWRFSIQLNLSSKFNVEWVCIQSPPNETHNFSHNDFIKMKLFLIIWNFFYFCLFSRSINLIKHLHKYWQIIWTRCDFILWFINDTGFLYFHCLIIKFINLIFKLEIFLSWFLFRQISTN